MENNITQERKYFGAANGYSGFRSNFKSIFNPDTLDKLFIIKGGPGTGKSTLMRRIKENFKESADVITILCSSDPDSLDGLLISKDGITVGIADGTSPHTLDAEYPGAVEEIVNLGDGFDFGKLRARKQDILSLSQSKKMHYKSAYASLGVAGNIYEYICSYFLNCQYYNEAEKEIRNLINDDIGCSQGSVMSSFLVSSFSKNGYKRLPHLTEERRKVNIKGDGISEYVLLSQIKKSLDKTERNYRIFFSAFSEKIPDIIETDNSIYVISDDSDYSLDSSLFMPKTCEYDRLKSSYRCFIENSQLSLIKASEYHFKLEDIYSYAISFDSNEEKYVDVINKINHIFYK